MATTKSYQNFQLRSNPAKMLRSTSIQDSSAKLIIILVGLPARGKSYISRKICTFLNWRGNNCRVFNAGNYRRDLMAGENTHNQNLFNPDKSESVKKRKKIALGLLEKAIGWLRSKDGQIAIFDATNTTKARRKDLVERINNENQSERGRFRHLFIESICDKKEVVESNYLSKIKLSPDFEGYSLEEAVAQIKLRLSLYEKVYETITDDENIGYIKLINLGTKLISHKLSGYLSHLLMIFLLNLNIEESKIWLTRAGKSNNDQNQIDFKPKEDNLSDEGLLFAKRLADFMTKQNQTGFQIWTSPLKRAMQTIKFFNINRETDKGSQQIDSTGVKETVSLYVTAKLRVIHQGDCYGMPFSAIRETYPKLYQDWKNDPLYNRFPGGESYMDGVERMESTVIDLEHISSPVLIVTHISILRILYAYFKSLPLSDVIDLDIPQGMVVEFKPSLTGWIEERFSLMDTNVTTRETEMGKGIETIPIENKILIA